MKLTLSTTHGGGAVCVWFQVSKKHPAAGRDLNSLMVNVLSDVLKLKQRSKYAATNDFGS